MFKNNIKELLKRIKRKRTIEQELAIVRNRLSSARLIAVDRVGREFSEARQRLESFNNRHGITSSLQLTDQGNRRDELLTLKDNVERLGQEYQKLKAEKEGLIADHERLQKELADFDFTVERAVLVGHLKEIDNANTTVATIEAAIARQQAIINDNQVESAKELHISRQTILADQAMGGDSGRDFVKELHEVDKKIAAKEKKGAETAKLTADAQNAIDGLSRKLQGAKAELERMEADHKEMAVFFLKTEKEKLAQEHRSLIESIKDSHCRLSAMTMTLDLLTGEKYGDEPALRLKFTVNASDIEKAISIEQTRLAKVGVRC